MPNFSFATPPRGNRTIHQTNTWGTGINRKHFTVNTANDNRLGVPAGGSGVMSYDAAGNLINDTYTGMANPGGNNRNYDAENRMTKAWGGNNQWQEYTYNADGQRTRREVDGVVIWQIYGFDGELVAEYAASAAPTSPQKEYGYRNGQLLVTATAPVTLGTGLRGQYFDNMNFTDLKVTRTDATVNFDWGGGTPDPAIAVDTFTTRWQGKVEPQYSETYTFYTHSDDGVRSWVNGQLLIDKWIDQGPTEWSGQIALTGGQRYDVVMEFYENGGGAMAKLWWSSSSQAKQIIPQSRLYPPGSSSLVTFEWMVADQLGTPRIILDKTGSLATTKRHDYLPFGEELFAGGRTSALGYTGDTIRQKFTGYEHDNETDLEFAQARYYASVQGRFTGVDPISGHPGSPQTWNRYAYVGNNPLKYIDPSGMNYFVGGSGANDPFIKEYRVDGFDMGPEGTTSQLTSESMLPYTPHEALLSEGQTSSDEVTDSVPASATITIGEPHVVMDAPCRGGYCTGIQSIFQIIIYDQYSQAMTGIWVTETVSQVGGLPTGTAQASYPVRPDSNGVIRDAVGPVLRTSKPIQNTRIMGGIVQGMLENPAAPVTFEQTLTIGLIGRGPIATAVSQRTFTNMDQGKLRPYTDPRVGGLMNNFVFTSTRVTVIPVSKTPPLH